MTNESMENEIQICISCESTLIDANYENYEKEICTGTICVNTNCELYQKEGYGL